MNRFELGIPTWIMLFGACLIGDNAMGSSRDNSVSPSFTKHISGASNPELIEDSTKLKMLVATYEHFSRKELSSRLSGSDLNVLDSLVSDDAFETKRESDQMAGELLALCGQRDALPPVALAARYEAIALSAREQTGARLTKAISQLSSEGRAQLREYVDFRITPKVSRTESSSIDLAKSDPEAFLANFDMICHIQRTGRLPDSMGGQRVISGGEYIDGVSGVETEENGK